MQERFSTDEATLKHVTYTRVAADLPSAWAFVLDHVDEFMAPTIRISPVWNGGGNEFDYEAVVSGRAGA